MNDTKSRTRIILERAKRRKRARLIAYRFIIPTTIALALIFIFSITGKAADQKQDVTFKYFTNVLVTPGTSLEDLAAEYMEGSEEDLSAYVAEVRSINHLEGEVEAKPGDYLILPYYSPEFK